MSDLARPDRRSPGQVAYEAYYGLDNSNTRWHRMKESERSPWERTAQVLQGPDVIRQRFATCDSQTEVHRVEAFLLGWSDDEEWTKMEVLRCAAIRLRELRDR